MFLALCNLEVDVFYDTDDVICLYITFGRRRGSMGVQCLSTRRPQIFIATWAMCIEKILREPT